MVKKAFIYINYNNIVVLQSYLDVVKDSLERVGIHCEYTRNLDGVGKKDIIVFPMGIDAFKYYFKGYHNLILWQQGTTADESFMRNHSKLRYWILNKMDLFAMKKAKAILYVSQYMRDYYEKLGKCSFTNKSYLMPCFNEVYDRVVFDSKDYTKKVFTYVGSLDLWQCFEQTVDIYKRIEDKLQDCYFKVLTFDEEKGKRILEEKGVKNFSVKRVPKEEVKKELLEANYGFIIREDSIVNRVATPTKFSSYLSSGVIPIFSKCLTDFTQESSKMKYALPLDEDINVTSLLDFVKQEVKKEEISKEYERLFSEYYSPEHHTKQLTLLFNKLGIGGNS
jgi:hypothetical protein